jgi:hypothetical protein
MTRSPLTAIDAINTPHFVRDFAPTNRLQTAGMDHLLSTAQTLGYGGSWRTTAARSRTHVPVGR